MSRFFACLLFALPLSAADLTGHWVATLKAGGREYPMHLQLKRAGEQLAGAFGHTNDFLWPIRAGWVREDGLGFVLRLPDGAEATFTGQFSGDSIAGRLTSAIPALESTVVMKKAGPLSRVPSPLAPRLEMDLGTLSDEFAASDSPERWKSLSEVEGLPGRIEHLDMGRQHPGCMRVVPKSGAWWAGYHGVFLFQEVRGDFVVTTRLHVTGRTGGEPLNPWTMSGLLIRAPGNLQIPAAERRENWIYLMTGRGPREARVVDAKSTRNSANAWDITPAQAGWYELRIARIGSLFLLFVRPDGAPWQARKVIVREDLPDAVQVGINVTSDYKTSASMPAVKYNAELFSSPSPVDSATLVDWVRFTPVPHRGSALSRIAGKPLLEVADEDILRLVP